MVWLLGSDEKIHSLVLDERFRQAGFSSVTTSEVVAFRDFLATDPSILLELEEEIGRTVDGGGTGDRKERVLPSFLMRGEDGWWWIIMVWRGKGDWNGVNTFRFTLATGGDWDRRAVVVVFE